MNDPIDPALLRANLAEAQTALETFANGPARESADRIADAFERSGARIARSLSRAAADGTLTFKEMAKAILEEIARAALAQWLPQGAAVSGRTRQPSLAAAPGAWPGAAGAKPSAPSVSVTIQVGAGGDAEGFMRHRGQIAADVARAVAYGSRNL